MTTLHHQSCVGCVVGGGSAPVAGGSVGPASISDTIGWRMDRRSSGSGAAVASVPWAAGVRVWQIERNREAVEGGDGKIVDKGCGAKKPDKTFGNSILTNAVAK
jgi:hypothetical protein